LKAYFNLKIQRVIIDNHALLNNYHANNRNWKASRRLPKAFKPAIHTSWVEWRLLFLLLSLIDADWRQRAPASVSDYKRNKGLHSTRVQSGLYTSISAVARPGEGAQLQKEH